MVELRISEALKRLRREKGLTASEVSKRLGSSYTQTVYRRETPNANLTEHVIGEYLDAVGATVEEFAEVLMELHGAETETEEDESEFEEMVRMFKAWRASKRDG